MSGSNNALQPRLLQDALDAVNDVVENGTALDDGTLDSYQLTVERLYENIHTIYYSSTAGSAVRLSKEFAKILR
jgi:hypothetical protein